jgi:cysteine desulfurase
MPATSDLGGPSVAAGWAHSSSPIGRRQTPRLALARARSAVASLVGARPAEVRFTACVEDAVASAWCAALGRPGAARRVVVSAGDGAADAEFIGRFESAGVCVDRIDVDRHGRIDEAAFAAALATPAALVSLTGAIPATGVLQPFARLALLARAHAVPVHIDATPIVGRLWLNLATMRIEFLSLAGSAIGDSSGLGALVAPEGAAIGSIVSAEGRLADIAGFGDAAAIVKQRLVAGAEHTSRLRNTFEGGLRGHCPGVRVHGERVPRLPHVSCVAFAGLDAGRALSLLRRPNRNRYTAVTIEAASPPALAALGVPREEAECSVRFALKHSSTRADVQALIAAVVARIVPKLSCLA